MRSTCFRKTSRVRENYNEFAKIFVESGMKLIQTDRPTADMTKDGRLRCTSASR